MTGKVTFVNTQLSTQPRLIFVGHEATRTGAPINLLHLMRWLRAEHAMPMSCVLCNGGPLTGDFAAVCPTTVLAELPWDTRAVRRRALGKARLGRVGAWLHRREALRSQIRNADLVYCNTIAALPGLELAARQARRVLVHVHELEFSFRSVAGPQATQRILDLADHFVACCNAVADNLVEGHSVPRGRVDVVHEFIPTHASPPSTIQLERQQLRERLGIAPDALLVGACGQPGWRKGTDLFVQAAALVLRQWNGSPVHFVWVGGQPESTGSQQLAYDLQLGGLAARVTHIPTLADPAPVFRGLDVFMLPSREDPYPLVCLEAAACKVPIICFDGAGGMPEFVGSECGVVVPYLRVDTIAGAVCSLLADAPRRLELGAAAQRRVRERHDVGIAGPKVLAAIHRALGATAARETTRYPSEPAGVVPG